TRVRVLDGAGTVLRAQERERRPSFWPELRGPFAHAAMTRDRDVRIVEVTMSQKTLLAFSAGVLALSATIGGAIALVMYFYPVNVVTGMERHLDELLTRQDSL